jgi:hypothetical protein
MQNWFDSGKGELLTYSFIGRPMKKIKICKEEARRKLMNKQKNSEIIHVA